MRDRSYRDLARRSVSGTVAYMLIWGIITVFFRGDFPNPSVFWFLGPLIILNTFIRILTAQSFERMYFTHRRLWKVLYFTGVFLAVAVWDYFMVAVVLESTDTMITSGLLVATTGLSAGGVSSFAPDRRIGLAYLATLLLPAYGAVLLGIQNQAIVASLLPVYILFLLMINSRQNSEYRRGLRNQIELEMQKGELEILHITDALTQVYNRYHFDEVLERELGRLNRESTNLALVLIDVDHFKAVNDTFGHPCGDEVLKQLAHLVGERLKRVNDTVARYGGEEFAVLLPATELDGALVVAEGIRAAVENSVFSCPSRQIRITVSMGVACTNRLEAKGELSLVARADVALYAAKRSGRNAVEAWSDDELEIPVMED